MLLLQFFIIAACLLLLIAVALKVRRGKLLLRYSLLWMGLAVAAIIGALFPGVVYSLSDFCGFETPSNFILFVGVAFLAVTCLSLSAVVSKQAIRIKTLIQEIALIENEERK